MSEFNEEQWTRNFLDRQIASVVERLRDLADTVERRLHSTENVGKQHGPKSYAWVAHEIQHDVLWGLANLSLDGLTTSAYDVDRARLSPETTE